MSIAVAYNDSDEGRAALAHGLTEAGLRRTELLVLHVVRDALDPAPETDHVRASVRDQVARSAQPGTVWSVRTVARGDDPAGALVDLLAETDAELLVLGSRRRSAIGKFIMGSTVQRVVLDATVPVLVVKGGPAG